MRHVLLARIERPDGERSWYRLSPKLQHAVTLEQHAACYRKAIEPLLNSFINVPLTPYCHGKAVIGVGRIKRLKWAKYDPDMLCTRSQFVDPKQGLLKSFHFLKHDYSKYSKLNIFVNLYNLKHER